MLKTTIMINKLTKMTRNRDKIDQNPSTIKVKKLKKKITNTGKIVPGTGARSAPAPGNRSELRRAKRAGARNVFPGSGAPCALEPGTVSGALILIVAQEKLNNAKGQLGLAHQSDNSFTEIQ